MQAVSPVTASKNSNQYFSNYINYCKLNPRPKPSVPVFKDLLAKEITK